MIIAQLQWKINETGFEFAEYTFTPALDDVQINTSNIFLPWRDDKIYARSLEATIRPDVNNPSGKAGCTIYIDGVPFSISGYCRLNLDSPKHITIRQGDAPGDIDFKFYSVPLFETAIFATGYIDAATGEPTGQIDYFPFVYNKGGVWCWHPTGTPPFNNDLPITTPIKLREPNPYRNNYFIFLGGYVNAVDTGYYGNARFPMFFGTSQGDQSCSFCAHNVWPPYDLNDYPQDAYFNLGAIIPKGEIWISSSPTIAASGSTLYSLPLSFRIA